MVNITRGDTAGPPNLADVRQSPQPIVVLRQQEGGNAVVAILLLQFRNSEPQSVALLDGGHHFTGQRGRARASAVSTCFFTSPEGHLHSRPTTKVHIQQRPQLLGAESFDVVHPSSRSIFSIAATICRSSSSDVVT